MNNSHSYDIPNKITLLKRRRLLIYKLLYKISYIHKPSTFLFTCSLILKFWGVFIISHLKEQNIQINSTFDFNFVSLLRKLTFTNSFKSTYPNPIVYMFICSCIYFLYSSSLCLYVCSFHLILNKTIENKSKRKRICYFMSIINFYCLFLLQHIIEVLGIIIFGLFVNEDDSNIGIFMNKFGYAKYIIALINLIFIIIANVQSFLFTLMQNKPFFSTVYPIKFYNQSRLFLIILFILVNFQSLQFINLVYSSVTVTKSIILIQISFLLLTLIIYFKNYQEDGSFLTKWLSFFFILCFYSSTVNLFLPKTISLCEYIESLLFEIISTIITDYLIKLFIYRHRRSNIRDMIFIAHKRKGRVDVYLTIILFLKQFMTNIFQQEELYEIINEHKEHCKAKKCLCCLFENVMYVLTKEKDKLHKESNLKLFLHLNEGLIAVLGKEIGLLYEQTIRDGTIQRLKEITLLYVDFTFYFMENINLGCFIVDKTLTKLHQKNKCDLFYGFTLFKIKKDNIEIYKRSLYINGNELKLQIKGYIYKNPIMKFWEVYKYQNIIFSIMRLIEKTILKLEKVINYGKVKQIAELHTLNSTSQKKYLEHILKFNNIYEAVYSFYESHKLLISYLKLYFYSKHKLLNFKTFYLTTLYFNTICNEIPKELHFILNTATFSNLIENSKYTFPETNFQYPVILTYDCDKNLSLLYICPLLAKKLGFKKHDIISQDIKIFLPKLFWIPHQLLVQRILIRNNIKPICIEMFILNKNGNYVPCECDLCYFPNLTRGLIINMNIQLKENEYDVVYFVLDMFGNFVCSSQNAERVFCLNEDIISKNKFNFFTFFNLNHSIFQEFNDVIHDIQNKNNLQIINKNDLVRKNYSFQHKEFLYDKSKLKDTFEKIKFYLQDSQTHFEIYNKLNMMDIKFSSFVEIVPNMFCNLDQHYSIIKQQLLLFNISLRKLDTLPFFQVKVSQIYPNYHFKQDTSLYISSMKKRNNINLIKSGNVLLPYGITHSKKSSMTIVDSSAKQKGTFFLLKNTITPSIYNSSEQKDKSRDLDVLVDIVNNPNSNMNTNDSSMCIQSDKKESNVNNVNSVAIEKQLTWKELIMLYNKINSNRKNGRNLLLLPLIGFIVIFGYHCLCLHNIETYISNANGLFLLTHSIGTFKYMIMLVSSLYLDGCISSSFPNETKFTFSEDIFNYHIQSRTNDMFENLHIFHNGLLQSSFDSIIQAFEQEETYYLLQDNWELKLTNSSLRDIVLLYHYYLELIDKKISISKCNITKYIKPSNEYEYNDPPTFLDKLYMFIVNNVLGKIYRRITFTYIAINERSNNEYNKVISRGIITYIILLIVYIVVITMFFIFIKQYILLIIQIVDLLISKKDHRVLYEKIHYFKIIAQDLSLNIYKEHQLKSTLDPFLQTSSLYKESSYANDTQFSISSSNKIGSFDGSGLGLLVMKVPSNKKTLKSYTTIHNKEDQTNNVLYENENSKSNVKGFKKIISNSLNENVLKKINYSKYLKSSFSLLTAIYFWGIVVLIFGMILILLSIFFKISKSTNEQKRIEYSINILEKENYFILLALSYKISILHFDPYLHTQYQLIEELNLPQTLFKDVYGKPEDISSYDIQFNSTFFGLFFKLTKLSTLNLHSLTIHIRSANIFHNLLKINNQLNSKEFCFYLIKNYFQLNQILPSSFEDFIQKSNTALRDCRINGKGINEEGIDVAFDYTFHHLINNYGDFIKDYNNGNKEKMYLYLYEEMMIKVLHNLEYTIDKAHLIKINEIKEEIKGNYYRWRCSEFMFFVLFVLFEIISLSIGSFFIRKITCYYDVLFEVSGYIFNSIKK